MHDRDHAYSTSFTRKCTYEKINYDLLQNMYLQEHKIKQKSCGRSLKIYNLNHLFHPKTENVIPLGGDLKCSEQFIPVSSCLHEVSLAVANPIFLVVKEPTTKPAVKHHRLLSTTWSRVNYLILLFVLFPQLHFQEEPLSDRTQNWPGSCIVAMRRCSFGQGILP